MSKIREVSGFLLTVAGFVLAGALNSYGQQKSPGLANEQAQSKDQSENQIKLENKALALLAEVVSEVNILKLPDNRIRVLLAAADLLWSRDPARSRDMATQASMVITQMMLTTNEENRDEADLAGRLRRELVLTVAPHDAELAFQLMRSTRPDLTDKRFDSNSESRLEDSLLTAIAATDQTMALKKTIESLDSGEFPSGITNVLRQLHSKDPEGFEKLTRKVISKLTPDNLLVSEDAGNLAINLLEPGPISEAEKARTTNSSSGEQNQVLRETAYRDLLDGTVSAALTAVRDNSAQGPNSLRVLFATSSKDAVWVKGDFYATKFSMISTSIRSDEPTNNARSLLSRLQRLLPKIGDFLPDRGQAIRRKLLEIGAGNEDDSMSIDVDESTSDSLLMAARSAPSQMQSELYEKAARKALAEGKYERALGIATDHLDTAGRQAIIEAVDLGRMAVNPTPEQMEIIRRKLEALPTSARVQAPVQMAAVAEKENQKLALKFLDEAVKIVSNRASSYSDFADQIKVSEALSKLDLKRSLALIEVGIAHLNEILAASAVVNGFEANVFREGELPLQDGSQLGNMVLRYGSALGSLANSDFDRARATSDKFQLPEARLFTRLMIVQRILGSGRDALNQN